MNDFDDNDAIDYMNAEAEREAREELLYREMNPEDPYYMGPTDDDGDWEGDDSYDEEASYIQDEDALDNDDEHRRQELLAGAAFIAAASGAAKPRHIDPAAVNQGLHHSQRAPKEEEHISWLHIVMLVIGFFLLWWIITLI